MAGLKLLIKHLWVKSPPLAAAVRCIIGVGGGGGAGGAGGGGGAGSIWFETPGIALGHVFFASC